MNLSLYGELRLEMYIGYRLFHYGDIIVMSRKTNEIVLGCMCDHLTCGCMYERFSNLRKTMILEYKVVSWKDQMCIYGL